MRNSLLKLLQILILVPFLAGCLKDKMTRTYTILTPVYQSRQEVLANIKADEPKLLQSPGKIYIYGKYLFVNEVNKGVHIFDNSNTLAPKAVAFINIPGNIDIAVKGTTLYADMYTDLLSIDITDPLAAKLKDTVGLVFPERQYTGRFQPDREKVIVDWIKKDTTVSNAESELRESCITCVFLADAGTKNGSQVPGIGGSMARFAIVNNYLYTVNTSSLGVFDIAVPAEPKSMGNHYIGWNIETIYPFKNKLFIGSSNGMFIYDISSPAAPSPEGSFSHARACDPVVADDSYAFVTLRTGTFCTGTSNQLDVVNVTNVNNPLLVKTYPLTNPHGLAKDENLLFICDGSAGLKVYDASNVNGLKLIKHIMGLETYDAIAWNNLLLVVASNGIYQFDYSDPANMKLLSTLAVSRK
jgi:hypothetical protein